MRILSILAGNDDSALSDGLWEQLAAEWENDQLVELVMLCGFYHTVSFLCRSFRVAHEEGSESFPTRAPGGS